MHRREQYGQVYGVHAIKADEISATAMLCSTLKKAEGYAKELSTDPGVLAAAVTRYIVDEQGRRTAVVLYVDGKAQNVPWISNDRRVLANGWSPNHGVK
ncbi:hypothetical protein GCM10023321_80390 [Pseudonocardia eucalypti]|uniref:Uncharacterized protein n=1 Tax=Pseudonocardia eucalypti TaxID=648755 RepID=A0ABP9RDD1_9PSEU|nr:hypothetical protein [Pseudonocardia eucalypti]